MGFPLADWIAEHADLPHRLGSSGMLGELRSTERLLERPRTGPTEPETLRRAVGERLGVEPSRVHLTHGATEGNSLVVHYVGASVRRETSRAPRARILRPEYPPLFDLAELTGWTTGEEGPADLWIRSEPHNPSGRLLGPAERARTGAGCGRWLLDETFREFSGAPSAAAEDREGLWTTGTLTKAFGADAVRVGWIVAPSSESTAYARFHAAAADGIPADSVRAALALLADAEAILAEARAIVGGNAALLASRIPSVGPSVGSVAFDRPGPRDTEAFGRACLERGVLVCPGHFFRDPSGVRLGLTRRDFPESLFAYLEVRRAFVAPTATPGPGPAARRRPRAARTGGAPPARRAPARPGRPARAGTTERTGRRGPGPSR